MGIALAGILLAFPARADEQVCMARAIYYETRASNTEESIAIMSVIINRTKQPKRFGGTFCEVIAQRGQFFWYNLNAIHYTKEWKKSLLLASMAIDNPDWEDNTDGALYFYSRPDWWFKNLIERKILKNGKLIGSHWFWSE